MDLALRRRETRDLLLALLYKVVNGHKAVAVEDLSFSKADNCISANPYDFRLNIPKANNDDFLNFFLRNAVVERNILPASVITAPSIASFNAQLS